MATYRYACQNCSKPFTVTRPMNSVNMAQPYCPHCCSMEILRVWEPVPVHYKGHGFYSTDVASAKEYEE